MGNFYKTSRSTGDGYTGYCILCMKEKATEHGKGLSPDKRLSKNKADWQKRKNDPEYQKKHAVTQKKWRSDNAELIRERSRQYRKAYRESDPEKARHRNAINNNSARAKRLGVGNTLQYVDWIEQLRRFENACAYCGATNCLLDVDHIVAMHLGGDNEPENTVPACRICNAQKSHRAFEEFCLLRGISQERAEEIKFVASF